ncbi:MULTISPECIES: hypothetical protein [Acinetobacter]|uniref:hypothetical protein n=1 Tax=Acinetobacter TaxID=469 RepID=UPI0015D0E083|nr:MULTISPECIES: hypothetical protein [Acinetobacter]MCO8055517.1 hypothetical protein [Acinetobacter towneri]
MKIDQVVLKGYRNYKDATINFNNNTLIIGENDTFSEIHFEGDGVFSGDADNILNVVEPFNESAMAYNL